MRNDAPEEQLAAPGDFVSRIESELLRTRKVLIFGDINDRLARDVCSRLLLLADRDPGEPIDVYINSPGGHVESGDTIHDMVRFVRNDVLLNILGAGWVASAGAHILLAGAKDRRFCLPNTRFLLHQPAGGTRGMAADIEIEARESLRMRERLVRSIFEQTGPPLRPIKKAMNR